MEEKKFLDNMGGLKVQGDSLRERRPKRNFLYHGRLFYILSFTLPSRYNGFSYEKLSGQKTP